MSNDSSSIKWEQNKGNTSEVLIDLKSSSGEDIKFFLDKNLINHIVQQRPPIMDIHVRIGEQNDEEVFTTDFSELKPVVKKGLTIKKSKRKDDFFTIENDESHTIGTYSIFFRNTQTWLGKKGWTPAQECFDIIQESNQKSGKTYANALSVSITPTEAVLTGAMWRLSGEKWQSGGTSAPVNSGYCMVEFKDLNGWITPEPIKIEIQQGKNQTISAEYVQKQEEKKTGLFNLNIKPNDVLNSGAKLRIDGASWEIPNKNPIKLLEGNHSIEFNDIEGWKKPKNKNIVIKKDESIQLEVEYTILKPKKPIRWIFILLVFALLCAGTYYFLFPQKGSLTVKLLPDEINALGAKWRVANMDWQLTEETVEVKHGSYLVEFTDIPQWTKPINQNVKIVKGKTVKIEGVYSKSSTEPAQISVTITPQEAVRAGAKWKIKGRENWKNSGDTIPVQSAGSLVIVFKEIERWKTPTEKQIYAQLGEQAQINANYTPSIISFTVRLHPPEAVSAGAKWKLDNSGEWKDSRESVAIGTDEQHMIRFKNVPRWITPEERRILGRNGSIDIYYQPEPEPPLISSSRSISVNINPMEAIQSGAVWKIEGPGDWKRSGETIDGLFDMSYTIIFKNIDGWIKPNNEIITIQGPGNISKTAAYKRVESESRINIPGNDFPSTSEIPGAGYLSVAINPNSVVHAGAKWKIPGQDWQESGNRIGPLVPMPITITFSNIAGWSKPEDIDITIHQGGNDYEVTYRRN